MADNDIIELTDLTRSAPDDGKDAGTADGTRDAAESQLFPPAEPRSVDWVDELLLDDLTPVDDAFETAVLVETTLARHSALFAKDGDAWRGIPLSFGCSHAEIGICSAGSLIGITIDTGIRIPPGFRTESNKLILLANSNLRLSGFKPLAPGDDAIVFFFDLDRSVIEHAREDADGLAASHVGDGGGDGCTTIGAGDGETECTTLEADVDAGERTTVDAGGEKGRPRINHPNPDRPDENALALCLGLALSTVRAYTTKFNAIMFGGRSALDAFER